MHRHPAASPRRILVVLFVLACAPDGFAQTALDRLGAIVKDGHLSVEADLQPGRVPAIPTYALEVEGSPLTHVVADAQSGRVTKLRFAVEKGRLIVRGKGLRPKVSIESLDFESSQGITGLRFRGLGIWRPIVAIFGGIARSAVRKLELKTDIPSVLKGEILGGKKPPEAAPTSEASPTPAPAQRSFLDVVSEVRILEMTLTAFEGRTLDFQPFLEFQTPARSGDGETVRLTIDKGVFRPGRDGAPSRLDVSGKLDGTIENGTMQFGKDRSTISRGRISGGTFQAGTDGEGKLTSSFGASQLAFEMSSGHFEVPGGLRVDLDSGSRFAVADARVSPTGSFSGVVDMELTGKTGELARQGAKLSTNNMTLRSHGLRIEDNRASGPVELSFDYRLLYPFVVKYPIKEIAEKRVPLEFYGPFTTTLELEDAGADSGEVRGDYRFKAPWPPIEKAALEVLSAKWRQDVAVKNVDFTIVPKVFRPCGISCFSLAFEFTAEKRQGKKSLFSQFCAPLGKAELYVDKEARAFILRDVRIETHCKGVVGWVANLIAPLLAKTYSDAVLFKIPPELPLSVDTVRGGVEWIEIGGRIDWKAGESAAPAAAARLETKR
ncbi:MAG TPA: hypothetical protein VGL03_07500 [Thermoanaerobaculia bacterium]|jgi:hypothetical protein